MWATRDQYYSSMKWHLADASTLEEYDSEPNWYSKKIQKLKRVELICPSGQGIPELLLKAKIKDKINVFQNNVCSYCRNKVLKDEGIESRLLK